MADAALCTESQLESPSAVAQPGENEQRLVVQARLGGDLSSAMDVLRRAGAVKVRMAIDPPAADRVLAAKLGLDRFLVAEFGSAADASSARRELIDHAKDTFERVESDVVGELHSIPPTDPAFGNQWYMANTGQTVDFQTGTPGVDIRWINAVSVNASLAPVTIAVLDTGLSPTHPEFIGRTVQGRNVTLGNGGDPNNTADSLSLSHGTKCAGIIGAASDNQQGIAGVAPNSRIMPIKIQVSSTIGAGYGANGLTWAADNGARIASMSWGLPATATNLSLLRTAVLYAQGRGMLLVASTGNTPGAAIGYPAAWPEVMAIGATDSQDNLAVFTTTGPELDMVAPGTSIYTTVDLATNPNGYAFENGTSFAAPMTAAVAALVWGINPSLSAAEVRAILEQSAYDLGMAGYDSTFGYGRLNAYAAVREALATLPHCAVDLNSNQVADIGDLFYFLDLYFRFNGQVGEVGSADFNGDGRVDVGDLFAFMNGWFVGCN